jgi:hypothetical protein
MAAQPCAELSVITAQLLFFTRLKCDNTAKVMAMKGGLDMVYAKSMSGYPHGYALYQPTTTDAAFPGACGFIDSRGTWHMLFSLHDEAALTKLGLLKPADQLHMAPANCDIRWDPKHSSKMDESLVSFKGGVESVLRHPNTIRSMLTPLDE